MSASIPPTATGTSRLIWTIALPAMLTNVATALFGLADMWVIGQLGDAPAQGAVELGAKFMLGLLTVFNFLRTGTIALTAQAAGRGSPQEQATALTRAIAAAMAIGIALLLVQTWSVPAGLDLLEAQGAVAEGARVYVGIRYWGGPIWLVNAVLVGWLIGQRRVRTVLYVEIAANLVHIALDLALVLGLGWGVAGVAIATVVSEALKLAVLAAIIGAQPAARTAWQAVRLPSTWEARDLRPLFSLNRDLFLRTLLLMAAILIFTRSGAQQGSVILAANGILFQLFMLSTLLLDGFENASQVLCGEAKGAADRTKFIAVVRLSMLWGLATGMIICAVYLTAGDWIAASFSTDQAVAETASGYMIWVAILPLVGVVSFVLDGVYVGAGWTRAMLLAMVVAMALYCAMLYLASPLANTELWLAFVLFFLIRTAVQFALLRGLIAREFSVFGK